MSTSKRALEKAAELLGSDRAAARVYLRGIQNLIGQVPYEIIVPAMHQVDGLAPEAVAERIRCDLMDNESLLQNAQKQQPQK